MAVTAAEVAVMEVEDAVKVEADTAAEAVVVDTVAVDTVAVAAVTVVAATVGTGTVDPGTRGVAVAVMVVAGGAKWIALSLGSMSFVLSGSLDSSVVMVPIMVMLWLSVWCSLF